MTSRARPALTERLISQPTGPTGPTEDTEVAAAIVAIVRSRQYVSRCRLAVAYNGTIVAGRMPALDALFDGLPVSRSAPETDNGDSDQFDQFVRS